MSRELDGEGDQARSGIWVAEREGDTTLTIMARNRLVSWIVTLLAVFPVLGALLLAVNGLRVSDYLSAAVMFAVAVAMAWLAWHIGWRKRAFRIVFHGDHLRAGPHRIAYSDIVSCGLSRDGGDPYDPATMGVPRNYSAGLHVFVQTGARRLPITVGLTEDQARHTLRLVERYLEEFRAG